MIVHAQFGAVDYITRSTQLGDEIMRQQIKGQWTFLYFNDAIKCQPNTRVGTRFNYVPHNDSSTCFQRGNEKHLYLSDKAYKTEDITRWYSLEYFIISITAWLQIILAHCLVSVVAHNQNCQWIIPSNDGLYDILERAQHFIFGLSKVITLFCNMTRNLLQNNCFRSVCMSMPLYVQTSATLWMPSRSDCLEVCVVSSISTLAFYSRSLWPFATAINTFAVRRGWATCWTILFEYTGP